MNPHAAVAHAATDLAHAPAAPPPPTPGRAQTLSTARRDASAPGIGAASAVAASAVARRYGAGESAVDALRGVSLDVPAGQFVAVMGPSGSGKSTLMHLLAGLDRPTAGSVHVGGEDITAMSDKQLTKLRRRHIGFVFQQFNLLPTLSAEENITLPLAIARERRDRAEIDALIERVGLGERRGHRPGQLSGGQQQRVAIARALVTRPTVLFADEPTGNLDSSSGADVLALLREAVEADRQTTVMVTHDPRAAASADRVVFLADGRIVGDLASPSEDAVLAAMKDAAR
jgi:putative ABC transport system ATP-binding protein